MESKIANCANIGLFSAITWICNIIEHIETDMSIIIKRDSDWSKATILFRNSTKKFLINDISLGLFKKFFTDIVLKDFFAENRKRIINVHLNTKIHKNWVKSNWKKVLILNFAENFNLKKINKKFKWLFTWIFFDSFN